MIRDLPGGERPRERLRDRGPAYLSNAELLAILLRTGSAAESVLDMASRLLAAEMAVLEQEHFRVLVMNTKNQVVASPVVFVGSVNSTTIRTAEVFREVVRRNCPNLIVVHNHPSGYPEPSAEDGAVTKEIVAAGRALDIEVVDHVVIARDSYVSLEERGLGF